MFRLYVICAALLLCILIGAGSAKAQTPNNWLLLVGTTGPKSVLGSGIGINPNAKDGYDGNPTDGDLSLHPDPRTAGIFLLNYYVQGPDWIGATGFYDGDPDLTPLPPGGTSDLVQLLPLGPELHSDARQPGANRAAVRNQGTFLPPATAPTSSLTMSPPPATGQGSLWTSG